jgi:peptide/nickel transport system substrate-binding protein
MATGASSASTRAGATKTISNSAKAGSSVLTASLNEAPVSLDPEGAESVNGGTDEVCGNTLSGLVARNAAGALVKGPLTSSWSQPNADTWNFALNPQARWSNGAPLTSADVKASLEETIKLGGPTSPLFAAITSVDTPSASDVVIHTSTPVGELLANLTMLYIGPAADVANPTYWNKPLSSGPFMVANFVPDESVTLVANPKWWGAPAKVHEVKLTFYANETDETTAVASGSLDYAFDLAETQLQDLQHASGVTVGSLPSYYYYILWFNDSQKPFTNPKVRQAMWYALPIASINKALFGITATTAHGIVPGSVPGAANEPPYPYDPAKAKQLLAEAGYPNGFITSITFEPGLSPNINNLLAAYQAYWAKVGVTVELVEQDPATYITDLLALKWSMTSVASASLNGTQDYILGRLFNSSAHRMGYSNPTVDKLIAQAEATSSLTLQTKLWGEVSNILWTNAVGIYPLWLKDVYAMRSNVKGVILPPNEIPVFSSATVG